MYVSPTGSGSLENPNTGMYVLPSVQKYCEVSYNKVADWEMGARFSSQLLLPTASACHRVVL